MGCQVSAHGKSTEKRGMHDKGDNLLERRLEFQRQTADHLESIL